MQIYLKTCLNCGKKFEFEFSYYEDSNVPVFCCGECSNEYFIREVEKPTSSTILDPIFEKKIEENKIICGNALDEIYKIPSNSVDLIITSPPYFNQRKYTDSKKEIGLEKLKEQYIYSLINIFSECVRVIKPTGSIIWNMGDSYKDKCLQLIPYRFAILAIDSFKNLKLINDITWVKTNPTPRQYTKRLIPSTEPFFHFVKSDNYYYDINSFLEEKTSKVSNVSNKKGDKYIELIKKSDLSDEEKANALLSIEKTLQELRSNEITDFRVKIRGVHKKAFGGMSGGRNNQIDKQGFTIIKMYGNKLKRDVIESAVANTKDIDHKAVFPLQVINNMILLLTQEDELVLDPFCGSGQSLVAAKLLKRKYLGIDLSREFCDMAEKRLNNL